VKSGLRENAAQFGLLMLINGFVGAMVGMERTILPDLAEDEFAIAGKTALLSFIAVFGLTKALSNYMAGTLAENGRRRVLIAGWLAAAPVPFLLMWAPTWGWVLLANALLGVSQGLSWSATVIMKIDLAGSKQRGLAMGLNEFAGYAAVGLSALATGWVAAQHGLRPAPMWLGVGFVVLGLGLSLLFTRETREIALLEAAEPTPPGEGISLFMASQAGLANNLNDGVAWGLFPLIYGAANIPLASIALLVAIYPTVWGVGQLFTGALSDVVGRRILIVLGMWIQALSIAAVVFATEFWGYGIAAALQGLGTAMVYPTLLAAVADGSAPTARATAVGTYRLWRDLGYVVGALLAGAIADAFSIDAAVLSVAAITFLSGALVAFRALQSEASSDLPSAL